MEDLAYKISNYYFFNYYIKRHIDPDVVLHENEIKKLFGWQYENKFLPKNLKYFKKLVEDHKLDMSFDYKKFIDISIKYSIDYNVDFPYPPQIVSDAAWKAYERNKVESIKIKDTFYKDLIERVKLFFVFLNGRKIADVLNNPILSNRIVNSYADDSIDLCVYCFSKSFMEFAKNNDMLIDFNKEQAIIKKYEKLLDKIKEKLKDDFMEV